MLASSSPNLLQHRMPRKWYFRGTLPVGRALILFSAALHDIRYQIYFSEDPGRSYLVYRLEGARRPAHGDLTFCSVWKAFRSRRWYGTNPRDIPSFFFLFNHPGWLPVVGWFLCEGLYPTKNTANVILRVISCDTPVDHRR